MTVSALTANPTVNGSTLKQAINRGQLTSIPDWLQATLFGSVLRSLHTQLWGAAPLAAGVNPFVNGTSVSLYLPDDAKALTVTRAYARTGTGTAGPLTVAADGTSDPSASNVAVSASGDLIFHGADAWTAVDVTYHPQKVDVAILSLPVVSNVATLPLTLEGQTAIYFTLMEAQAVTGTTTGNAAVLEPGSAPGAAHEANFNLAKTEVQFYSVDAVTNCQVKVGIAPSVNLNSLLEAVSAFI
jgi:hypothetical protein